MKITKNKLIKLIDEEIHNVISEGALSDFFSDESSGITIGPDSAIKKVSNWLETILQKKSNSVADNFVNRVKKFSGLHKNIHKSFETDVSHDGDRIKISLAPDGPHHIRDHWLTLYIDTPVKIDKDKIRFSVHVNAFSGGGSQRYATTKGENLWAHDAHLKVGKEIKDAMLRIVASSFPNSAGMDDSDPSYPFYVEMDTDGASADEFTDAAFKILQLLYTPVVEIWSTLLFGNTIPYVVSRIRQGDSLGRIDVDTVPEIEKFWTTFDSVMQKF